jgi:hypothetical protein
MHNRIGRRAAAAGVDRMAAEDVMASVLHVLLNEAAVALWPRTGANVAMRPANPNRQSPAEVGALARISKTTDCAVRMSRAITRAITSFLRTSAAVGRGAVVLPVLTQFIRR